MEYINQYKIKRKKKFCFETFINDIILDIEEQYKEKFFPYKWIIESPTRNKYENE